jgi:hypothetical protein
VKIVFLDADDVLLPETLAEVVKVWEPRISKVQWRLQLANEKLQILPATCPARGASIGIFPASRPIWLARFLKLAHKLSPERVLHGQ